MGNSDSKSLAEDPVAGSTVATSPAANKRTKDGVEKGENGDKAHHDGDDQSSEKREADKQNNKRSSSTNKRDTSQPLQRLTDEQINVNMAMADLMAYLQVVANNSNHLPLTRRDDPELDRTVSTLSSDDYARKSAAFVPSDVRILGGTFTRYGRVWDLPTSEEFNACDGAHEPGRSYGGAFCNTMLKVVYDAANEMEGAAQTEAATQSLFQDDEEDEDDDEPSINGKSFKSGYSLEFSHLHHGRITWAMMLRQLKSEFKEVGYAQTPKITTTRKLDLNTPFSLCPETFDPLKHKKRSLLIGCNYRNMPGAELKASHDDVRSMKDYIVNVHGFSEKSDLMTILLDDDTATPPTFCNIVEAFKTLSEEAQPGDAVFVQFSGHGGRVLDTVQNAESESYDEIICPIDYEQQGSIRDTLIFKTLLAPMRYGVTVTILIDCCDTGMVLDLPYAWNAKTDKKGSVAKLAMNEDFSFVRFLKVVKTLYESSTFTQLGKTVGSALNPLSGPIYSNKLDEESRKSGRGNNRSKDGKKSTRSPGTESIFDVFSDACSAVQKDSVRRGESMSKDDQKSSITRKDTLLEQMIKGCSLLSSPADDEFSDEDTFKTRTEDDHSYFSEGESFETMTATETNRGVGVSGDTEQWRD